MLPRSSSLQLGASAKPLGAMESFHSVHRQEKQKSNDFKFNIFLSKFLPEIQPRKGSEGLVENTHLLWLRQKHHLQGATEQLHCTHFLMPCAMEFLHTANKNILVIQKLYDEDTNGIDSNKNLYDEDTNEIDSNKNLIDQNKVHFFIH